MAGVLHEHPVQMFMESAHRKPIRSRWEARHIHRDPTAARMILLLNAPPSRVTWDEAAPEIRTYRFYFPEVGIDTFLEMGLCTCGDLFVVEEPEAEYRQLD